MIPSTPRLTALLLTMLAILVAGATPASAQSTGEKGQRQGTSVRTSATVEVIESTAAVDDIIGRLRKEQRDRAGADHSGTPQNSGGAGSAAQVTPAQSRDRTAVRELKQERRASKQTGPRGELPSSARPENRQGGPDGNPAAERRQMGARRPAGAGRTQ